MYELEINEIEQIINIAPVNMNLMFIGDTGVGKTTAIKNYCHKNGIFLKTLILSRLEASESLGIPIKRTKNFDGKEYDVLSTAIPEWVFELKQHDKAILFLDEFLCTQPSVMNSFLNFLTEKRVEDIDLSHVKIIAATNIGNYTFEPDNNILSRFCFFYVVNNHCNEFLKDKRIINNYVDKNERQGIIFDPRSLKPRCQELLMEIPDKYLQIFYEGFTNSKYIMVHTNDEINDIISPYFEPESCNHFKISDENIKVMVALLIKTFARFKKWDKIYEGFVNIDLETVNKIKTAIEYYIKEQYGGNQETN